MSDTPLDALLKALSAMLPAKPVRRPTSRLYRDPEVAALVNELLDRGLTYAAIQSRCLAQFGPKRTPSHSAIGRYSQQGRRQTT